ncbi:MAG: hypothetical protein VX346_14825 [Planctomycetota bacterium]|nr:hypothetical protein [Planctomycetota bacterium]
MTSIEAPFVDRRRSGTASMAPGTERRQFSNSHQNLSLPAQELAHAIDSYKLNNRRRFITCEEMLEVILGLGYQKS